MGCYATRAPEEVAALPGVAEVVTDKRELPDLLGRFGVIDVPDRHLARSANRHRAYVKVQDGCMLQLQLLHHPHVRPHLASRPVEHILDEVRRLVDNGYREVVLTGIHWATTASSGTAAGRSASGCGCRTCSSDSPSLPGEFRVRLSSIEATEVTRELIAVMAEHPERSLPAPAHLAAKRLRRRLRRMRRRWGSRRFIDRCRWCATRSTSPAITTDIIVGFPRRNRGRLCRDLSACAEEVGFSKIHIFPFSPRRSTPAARCRTRSRRT